MFELCDVGECLGHFDGIVPSQCILTKQHGVHDGDTVPLENPWKWHFQDSKFENVPRCLSPKKLVPLVLVEPN